VCLYCRLCAGPRVAHQPRARSHRCARHADHVVRQSRSGADPLRCIGIPRRSRAHLERPGIRRHLGASHGAERQPLPGVDRNGSWLRARIVYDDGKPAGIADAEMAPILGSDGKPLAARGWFDTESLAEADGIIYVGIERVEKIVRFNYTRDGLKARGEPIAVPDDFKTFTFNKSLECLTVPPAGAPHAGVLIAVTERSLDAQGNHRSYLLKGDKVARFFVKRSDGFDVSDCTILPPADLLLLERSYTRLRNIRMRIRRIPLALIKPDTLVDGKVLITADFAYQIDNMEGIAVHRNADGETIITLVSDDNFSFIQRNLLLQFALVGQ